MTALSVLELLVTALLLTRMVLVGFFQPAGRVLSWPMFCRNCAIDIELYVQEPNLARYVNVFDLLPSGFFCISSRDLQLIVEYLEEMGGRVTGDGQILYAEGERTVRVASGRVVV